MGNTKVLAAVYGPREVQRRSQAQQDKCNINVEFSMARRRRPPRPPPQQPSSSPAPAVLSPPFPSTLSSPPKPQPTHTLTPLPVRGYPPLAAVSARRRPPSPSASAES